MNGKWGVYPWVIEQGTELIHHDDLEDFRKQASNCKVYQCVDVSEYLTLKYQSRCYRVKAELFRTIPTPRFEFGQSVIIKKSGQKAVVSDIMWHYDRQQHYYFLIVENKRKSKRYFESELSV